METFNPIPSEATYLHSCRPNQCPILSGRSSDSFDIITPQVGRTIRPSFFASGRTTQKLFHSRRLDNVKHCITTNDLVDARRKKPPSLVPRLRGLTGKGLAS